MKKQKENSLGSKTWSEMGKQNVQAIKEVDYYTMTLHVGSFFLRPRCIFHLPKRFLNIYAKK